MTIVLTLAAELENNITTPASQLSMFNVTNAECDACFGVITATPISSFSSTTGTSVAPVNVKPFGGNIKLNFQDSNKYAGILVLPVLCRLLDDFTVRLEATLISESHQKPKSKKQKAVVSKECSIRIIVYGMKGDKHNIGNLLSDAGLCFQHPSALECDEHVEYCNPHYLLRPGSQMPALENLSLTAENPRSPQSDKLDEANMARLLRIFDSAGADESEASVTVDPSPRLSSTLMEHQLTALAMMIERECGVESLRFPTLWVPAPNNQYRHIITGARQSKPTPIRGGVLADEMGLGKTLSVLALICSSLDGPYSQITCPRVVRPVGTLVICPKSTITAWQDQISRHIFPNQIKSAVYHGPGRRLLAKKLENYEVVLTTYETLRSEWENRGPLYTGRWLRIVLDEAHHIRNRSSQVFKATLEIQAHYRWCLSGTPIHNSLDDYGALLTFIKVNPFSKKSMFDYWITSPVKEKKLGSLEKLKNLVRATCLRRTKASCAVSLDLLKPVEEIQYVDLSKEDQEIYTFFKKKTADIAMGNHLIRGVRANEGAPKEGNILSLINILRLICDHGISLLPPKALAAWSQQDSSLVDWQMMKSSRRTCVRCEEDLEEMDVYPIKSRFLEANRRQSLCSACAALNEANTDEQTRIHPEEMRKKATMGKTSKSIIGVPGPSNKVESLLLNLNREQGSGEGGSVVKSVVFSFWTKMLDLIESTLRRSNFTIQRIDGQTSLEGRGEALRQFNKFEGCVVMLASIGSCGEGVDFTAASNVHIMEPQWNPMVEAQAVDRVHRKGQTKLVTITRYITPKSIETYIQCVQQDKMALINQSINNVAESEARDLESKRCKMLEAYLQ
ncbi:SNF2 family N-terminal domain-containing protein [Whalleya microplaca]|nr:SNF2 family N-terminal domain-containing protein [Whalleya microplaca]